MPADALERQLLISSTYMGTGVCEIHIINCENS